MNSKLQVKKSKFIEWRNAFTFAVVFATLFRWSLAEAFVIPTGSMENSLLVGDYILVSKVHYGPRTPHTPLQIPLTHQNIWGTDIPSYLDWIQLPSYRFPGIRQVERGETVVFNTPKDLLEPMERPTDLMTYLVKRCIAVSGDVIQIKDRQVYINGKPTANPFDIKFRYKVTTEYPLQQHNWVNIGLGNDDYGFMGYNKDNKAVYNMLLTEGQLNSFNIAPSTISVESFPASPSEFPLFPAMIHNSWSLSNYGPITVPKKGMVINANDSTLKIYGELIEEYEGQDAVRVSNGKLEIGGLGVDQYTFQQDYYFMMGDSRDNSIDSRFWGFVPEDHIVGKPVLVLFSKDGHGEGWDKIRWTRIFSSID